MVSRLVQTNVNSTRKKIEFFGHIFSGDGISPDPYKIKALRDATQPQNKSEVRSFLGMAQYSSRFIPDFATITEPLRKLTKIDEEWHWDDTEETAFQNIKKSLCEQVTTSYFNPSKETTIHVDASPVGISAILSQDNRVVMYASRALTDVEQRYSQTDREALAVVWACEYFNIYVSGSHFTVITDHKPLLGIWKSKHPRLRIARWALRLQPYTMTLKYKPGKDNPADYMSRHPLPETNSCSREQKVAEEYVNLIIRSSTPKAISEDVIRQHTRRDHTLQAAIEMLEHDSWYEIKKYKDNDDIHYQALQSIRTVKDELTLDAEGDIILRDKRIVIPTSLQLRTIELAHEGHQGIAKTKALLRSKVWFPNMDKMTEDAVRKCLPCEVNNNRLNHEPLNMSSLPKAPWLKLSIDFCGPVPTGEYLLVLVDEFSRYPVVHIVNSTSAETIIPLLDQTFAIFGYPEVIKSDNGPPFQGSEWHAYLEQCGIRKRRITPLWPQANSQAECFNKPLMKAIRAATVEGRNWRKALIEFLRMYRTTPHSTTLFTPHRLLFGRDPRTKLPQTSSQEKHPDDEVVRARDNEQKQRMKEYADARRVVKHETLEPGDIVLLKQRQSNKMSTVRNPQPLIVSKQKGTMITAQFPDGSEVTRNQAYFRSLPDAPLESVVQRQPEPEIETSIPVL